MGDELELCVSEQEILEMKTKYEDELRKERESNVRSL